MQEQTHVYEPKPLQTIDRLNKQMCMSPSLYKPLTDFVQKWEQHGAFVGLARAIQL
jgi:hypothetical protein